MDTVSFQSVLHGVAHRMGIDPEQLQVNQARPICEFINSAVRRGWEMDVWWPWTVLEERRYRRDWSAGVTYAAGEEVWFPGASAYYRAEQSTANEQPDLFPAVWTEVQPDTWLLIGEEGYCPMGKVVAIYDSRGVDYAFTLQGDRIFLQPPAPALPVVCYTRPTPKFSVEPWATGTAYRSGSLVYYEAAGETYRAIADSQDEIPPETPERWVLVCFPAVLAEYVKQEAYARMLETDGQTERSAVAQARAERLLEEELDRVFLQQAQRRRFSVTK